MHEGEQQSAGHWQYKGEAGSGAAEGHHNNATKADVEWTASEFIAHHKGVLWYLCLIVAALIGSALVYLLTRDRITVGVVVICAIVFGITAARKPRILAYRLDNKGLTIGNRFYPYGDYRAFAVIDEGNFASITFLPFKRFMPGINIYYPPDDEDHIIETIATHLPMQPSINSALDHFMRRIRF